MCLADCVLGAHLLQGPSIDPATVAAAVAVAAYAVSMLMVHHYLDLDADAGADPPKVTSIVLPGARARTPLCDRVVPAGAGRRARRLGLRAPAAAAGGRVHGRAWSRIFAAGPTTSPRSPRTRP